MGTDQVVKENAEVWTIKSVELRPYGVSNPDSRYLMQFKPGALGYIGVAEDGMLLSINTEPEEPASEAEGEEAPIEGRYWPTGSISNMWMRIS